MRRILLGAAVIGAFLSLAAAGCDLSQNTSESSVNQTETVANTTSTTTTPTVETDVYTNTQYGFSVKVPSGYTVQTDDAVFSFVGPDTQSSLPFASISVASDTTVDAVIAKLTSDDSSVQIKSRQATTVDGRSATSITYDTPVGLTYNAIYVANGQRVYGMREVSGVASSILTSLKDTLHLL